MHTQKNYIVLVLVNLVLSLLLEGGIAYSCTTCYAQYKSGETITLMAAVAIIMAAVSVGHSICHGLMTKSDAPKWGRVYHAIMAIVMIGWPIYMGILALDNFDIVNY